MKKYIYSTNKLADDDFYALREIAETTTDSQELHKLAKYVNNDIRYWVAKNSNTSSNDLLYLSHDVSDKVGFQVAQNPNTPEEALRYLVNRYKSDYPILNAVLRNPNISTDILIKFVSNYGESISFNPNISSEVIIQLARVDHGFSNYNVYSNLAMNPNTSLEALKLIVPKLKKISRQYKINNPARNPACHLARLVANHPNASKELISQCKIFLSNYTPSIKNLHGYSVYIWTLNDILRRYLDEDWYSEEEIEDMGGEDALLDEAEQDFDAEFIPESDEDGIFRSEGTRVGTYSTLKEAEAKANSISDRCEIWDEDSGCWVI